MPRPPSLHDDDTRARGREALRRDPVLNRLIQGWGDVWPRRRVPAFAALIRTIVGQQISTAAAASIQRRLRDQFGAPIQPEQILAATDPTLRSCGLSRQKIRYLRSLAEHVVNGSLVLRRLPWLDEDAIRLQLTQVMGLGPWSAEMYMLFVLGRTDILSTGDLGLQTAARDLYGLDDRPDPATFRALAQPWHPYRGLASIYLWASLDNGTWNSR